MTAAVPVDNSNPPVPVAPPAPQGGEWIDCDECARRMGLSSGRAVRRFKIPEWAASGLAKQERTAAGQLAWRVREDADPMLSRNVDTRSDRSVLDVLTDEQQRVVLFREEAVLSLRSLRRRLPRGKWHDEAELLIAELAKRGQISRSNLYTWEQAHDQHGLAGLCDGRWAMPGELKPNDARQMYADFFKELETWYLDGNQPSMATAIRLATRIAQRNNWTIPHEKTARRYLARIKRTPRVERARRGADWFDSHCGAFLKRDYTRIIIDGQEQPMLTHDVWCADHHICDTIVTYEGKLLRPWLPVWEDLRSRFIVGYRFSPFAPDSSAVLLALRAAIVASDMCVPRFCYTDNGRDFSAWFLTGFTKWEKRSGRIDHDTQLFKGVYSRLQIQLWQAQPYNAKAKPVERFFGTYEDQFGKLTHAYCGRDPQHKPHHLEHRLKRGEAQSFADYVADATDWIERCYHNAPHSGHGMDGLSPNQVYAANLGELRIVGERDLEACLQKSSRPVKVGRNGVRWEGRDYSDPALRPYWGKEVMLYVDPDDLARVTVRTVDGVRICQAEEQQLSMFGAVNTPNWKDAYAKAKRHNKALAEVNRRGMHMKISPLDVMLDEHLSPPAPAAPTDQPPPTIKLIQTGLTDESKPVPTPVETAPRESVMDRLMRITPPRQMLAGDQIAADPWDKATRLREAANAG
jgi:hypothetical protein